MMIIPKEYYTKEKNVKLTEANIECLIDTLQNYVPKKIFNYLNLENIIKKLKQELGDNGLIDWNEKFI